VSRITIRAEYQAGNEELMEEDKSLLHYSLDTILAWKGDKKRMWVHAVKVARAISRVEIATLQVRLLRQSFQKKLKFKRERDDTDREEVNKRQRTVSTRAATTVVETKKSKRVAGSGNKRRKLMTATRAKKEK